MGFGGCRHLERDLSGTLPVLLMLLGCCTQGLLSDCPRMCECKWKSGKEAVSCVRANISAVPSDLDIGTQLLDLSDNNLMRLNEDEFYKAHLLNLQKVYLAKCRLKLIDRNAFRNLINLVELDLSQNFMYFVPSYLFQTMPELRELKLNGNPIHRINKESFLDVPKLVRIELSGCKIRTIEDRAFEGIEESLQWLKLDDNQLSEVKVSTFTSIEKMHGLELAGNPWNCSCALRPFREWMIRQNIPFEVPPTCKSPKRLSSKSWKNLDLDEFACIPRIRVSDPKAHGVEGTDVTITCTINGIPEPNIRWLLKNRVIANRTNVSYSSGKKQYVVHIQNNSSNLTIQTADVQDTGVYVCSAENKAGRAEASVNLAVSRKPLEDLSNNKVIIAGAVIAIVLVSVATLLTVCICSVRRRRQAIRWQGRRTASGRRHDDNYEKIEMSKLTSDNGGNSVPMASVAGDVPILGPTKRNGEYRVVPCLDTDQEVEEDEDATYDDNLETPTPTNVSKSRDTKLWTAAATGRSISSPNSGHWNSNVCDSNLDPDDLHIPRRTKEETRDAYSKTRNSTFGTYNLRESSISDLTGKTEKSHRILPNIPQSIQPHIMKRQILPNNGSLYSSIPVSSDIKMERLINSDLEECTADFKNVASNYEPSTSRVSTKYVRDDMDSTSDNLYCTLPRNKLAYGKCKSRYRSCDSESPLLPRSRYGSSGGDSSSGSRISSRRLSEDSLRFSHRSKQTSNLNQRSSSYLSLSSPRHSLYTSNKSSCDVTPPDSTPLLNVGALESRTRLEERKESLLSPSSNISLSSSRRSPFNDRAAQLELFLEGYINVHNQLSSMKEICDQMKQQQEEEKQLRAGLFVDPLRLNVHQSPDCQDSNPKSILKKSVSTLSSCTPVFMTKNHDSPSTSVTSDFNTDWSSYRTNQYETNKRFY